MNKILISLFLLFSVLAIDDSIFEPGTPKEPKLNLPYNDDVMVKTLVFIIIRIHF